MESYPGADQYSTPVPLTTSAFFTSEHNAWFERTYGLNEGVVLRQYQKRLGWQAKAALGELLEGTTHNGIDFMRTGITAFPPQTSVPPQEQEHPRPVYNISSDDERLATPRGNPARGKGISVRPRHIARPSYLSPEPFVHSISVRVAEEGEEGEEGEEEEWEEEDEEGNGPYARSQSPSSLSSRGSSSIATTDLDMPTPPGERYIATAIAEWEAWGSLTAPQPGAEATIPEWLRKAEMDEEARFQARQRSAIAASEPRTPPPALPAQRHETRVPSGSESRPIRVSELLLPTPMAHLFFLSLSIHTATAHKAPKMSHKTKKETNIPSPRPAAGTKLHPAHPERSPFLFTPREPARRNSEEAEEEQEVEEVEEAEVIEEKQDPHLSERGGQDNDEGYDDGAGGKHPDA